MVRSTVLHSAIAERSVFSSFQMFPGQSSGEQAVEECPRHPLDRLLRRVGVTVEETLHQRDDVLLPVPKRRYVIDTTRRRWYRSSPELPSRTMAARSRFVAEITRTFTCTSFVLPTG